MKQPIAKTILTKEDYYIQFTDEELAELNIEKGQKFTCDVHEDGSIKLTPYAKVELEMGDWPREVLELLIQESCEKDISVNDVFCDLLKEVIKDGNI
jgi:hypothetical protein